MESKIISLLMNAPTRHGFETIADSPTGGRRLVDKVRGMASNDLDNFFVFGNLSSIGKVFDTAEQLEMLDNKKYSWTVVTTETDSDVIKCQLCSKATVMYARPRPKAAVADIDGIKRTYDLTSNSDVDLGFYFDATLKAVMGIR